MNATNSEKEKGKSEAGKTKKYMVRKKNK